jgi:hypothetical protein
MENDLEETIKQETKDSWLKKAFKEEWPTMINHLASCGVAIGGATGFSYLAPKYIESDAAISGIATVIDMLGYWGTFIPQLMYRDREKVKNEKGELDKKKVAKKLGEYFGYMSIIEGVYAIGRFIGQYELQKHGWDPVTASATIQISATALFTFAFPPLRYAVRQWSEK